MSHVITGKTKFTSLDAVEAACQELGLELVRNQEAFRWFGRHVGDYPLPEFFTKEDMGLCSHAIRIPGNDKAYEIGLVECRESDGHGGYRVVEDTYNLMYDFYAGGKGMEEMVGGEQCSELNFAYLRVLAEETHQEHMQEYEMLENGDMLLTLRR